MESIRLPNGEWANLGGAYQLRKVIYVGTFPKDPQGILTGPERVTLNIVTEVARTPGYTAVVCLPHRFRNIGAPTHMSSLDHYSVCIIHALRMPHFLFQLRPDIIHVSGISYLGLTPFVLQGIHKNPPILYTAHGISSREMPYGQPFSFLDRLTERILLKNATSVVTVSEDARNMIIRDYRLPESKTVVIPNGLDPSLLQYPCTSDFLRQRYQITEKAIILFVGGLRKAKGLDFLMNGLLHVESNDFKLVAIGNSTPYWNELNRKYGRQMGPRILRIDSLRQQELANAYASCTLFVLPSAYEPFGLVAIEAMAFGKPVIVSDRVGMRFLMTHEQDGMVVRFNDPQALAASLDDLIRDPQKRMRMGIRAKQTAMSLTYESVARQYLNLYESSSLQA